MNAILASIKEAVLQRKTKEIEGLVRNALDSGANPGDIIGEALIPAMDEIGKDFSASRIFVPEMLVSAVTMKAGLNVVKPLLQAGQDGGRGKVLIATVRGDLHDIGKNIVAMMIEGAGFEIIDLGINIDRAKIVEEVATIRPDILGLSALLTTTMPEMGRVIDALEEAGLRKSVKVLVGGAPLSESFAREIGADGFGRDAAAAVDLCKRMIGE